MKKEDTQRDKLSGIVAKVKDARPQWRKAYRDQALKVLPWICALCGREFTGKKLRELTVHHKDNDPDNNPADGSNWELLCIYCHEHEHS
ncbi:MAG: YajD family HNH nuclease [Candidatus Omnitrophica bacterium]|nr:YajD family HNH nuclease [Candidatus Omnitrophota bacterium]